MRYSEMIKKVVEVMRRGGVIIFPTDTVWGMGAWLGSREGIEKLYFIKQRDERKPTAVLVENYEEAVKLGCFDNEVERAAKRFWPGGLTLVVEAKEKESVEMISGGTGKVGLRVPKHELSLALIHKLSGGIVAGSANFSTKKTPRKFEELDKNIKKMVDFVLDPGLVDKSEREKLRAGGLQASTVVDTTKKPWEIIRQGGVKI